MYKALSQLALKGRGTTNNNYESCSQGETKPHIHLLFLKVEKNKVSLESTNNSISELKR